MKFETLINGSNFLFDVEGKLKKHGFYQTVYVESSDAEQAELKAIEIIKNNHELVGMTKNKKNDPPKLNLHGIDEVDDFDDLQIMEIAKSFYLEKKWWMVWK